MGHYRKQMISFFVTSRCNFDCIYCYIPNMQDRIAKNDRNIDINFAIAGMKDFFKRCNTPHIRYFSAGEATLAFDKMVELYNEGYKLAGNNLKVELQTNGYFTDEIADWIDRHVDILWISIDGPPEIQDAQKPLKGGKGSSKVVVKNIERFAKHPTMQVGVRTTFMPNYYDRQIEFLNYFRELGVWRVCGAPAYLSPMNEGFDKYPPNLFNFSEHFVDAFYEAQKMDMFYLTHLMVNFDEKVPCYCRACTTPPCPQLTSDGYVSCCDWASFGQKYCSGSDFFQKFMQDCIYAEWDKKRGKIIYYEDKQKKIENRNVHILGQGYCKDCEVLEHCAGGCLGKVMSMSKKIYEGYEKWCEAVRYLAKEIPPSEQKKFPFYHS
jgi:sulfatase maturation enzyme AslB (radical SAM superfamily)